MISYKYNLNEFVTYVKEKDIGEILFPAQRRTSTHLDYSSKVSLTKAILSVFPTHKYEGDNMELEKEKA